MSDVIMGIKRFVRRFIPDEVMARYRLRQHSKHARVNVDLLVGNKAEARRWLATTPDTYRAVVTDSVPAAVCDNVVTIGEDAAQACGVLEATGADVAVIGRTAPPRLVGSRRSEPRIEPMSIAMRSDVSRALGDIPPTSDAARIVLARARDAGYHIAVQPTIVQDDIADIRTDPIVKEVCVILAGVPIDDIGGGSRATQLALEFVAQGYHVIYVELFGTQESSDLGLRFVSNDLEQYRWDRFDADVIAHRAVNAGLVLAEIPAPQFREVFGAFERHGWRTVYDVIDAWSDPALGGEWYDQETERWFTETADIVVASAPDLQEHLVSLGSEGTLISNAVNTALFTPRGSTVSELEDHPGPILGYHGSLYGSWFDWEALGAVADAFPEALVIIIGDDKAKHPQMPSNVRFTGLKAQFELPPWIRSFDIGLLPFEVSETTHAVSPLKVYEYLASGVPVAAPPLRALNGLPSVFTAAALVDAVEEAMHAGSVDTTLVRQLHGWDQRVRTIVQASSAQLPSTGGSVVDVVVRPVHHYGKRERLVGLATPGLSS